MGATWHELLRPLCAAACAAVGSDAAVEVVLFFVARWCQKETGAAEPDVAALDQDHLADIAARVVRNLGDDGVRVDRLYDRRRGGDVDAWTELRRLLFASACARVGVADADHYADEAQQKIAYVLITGTPPERAAAQLAEAIEGPRYEYVFSSPFPFWARTVVIHLIIDDKRRQKRESEAPPAHTPQKAAGLDAATLAHAHRALPAFHELPALLDAVRELPPVQRSVMVWTLARRDLDPAVTEHLRELAPDLFGETGDGTGTSEAGGPDASGPPASDREIAERLGTTARLVAANRSVARCKLAARDSHWKLLLEVLLPHRSTRPTHEEGRDG